MKIHADKLTASDIYKAAPDRTYVELVERGSRKRKRAFDVGLSASHGDDAHGLARVYSRNTGRTGAMGDYDRAATWIEWGDWMVELFKIDPQAVIGNYDGAEDFIQQTRDAAPHRPKREEAVSHAERWAGELELIKVCPECSSEEVERANEGRAFRCGNCGARFDDPLLAVS